jgi:hypothetical protein
MFRSVRENGERGTPEQWKIKPETTYPYDYLTFIFNSRLSIILLFSFGDILPF